MDPAEMRDEFEAIFGAGHIFTVRGPRGSGKSTWAAQVMQQAAEFGYAVFTNIMFKSPVRDATGNVVDWMPEHGYEKVQTPEMRRAGGVIIKVRSFAELVYALSELGILKRRQRVCFVLDESAMVAGMRGGAGSGMQTREGAMVAAFNTQIRKLGMCILIIGLGDRFLAGVYRSGESSMITGTMTRVKLAGYDLNEVIEFSTSINTEYIQTTPVRGIARPQSLLEAPDADNGPVFESFSPATFRMGEFRSGKPFDLGEFLIAMSDTISEKSAAAVAQFLELGGGKLPEVSKVGEVKTADVSEPAETSTQRVSTEKLVLSNRADEIRVLIRTTSLTDSEIGKRFGVSKQRVNGLRKEMRDRGQL